MPIVIDDFYKLIDYYTIRTPVAESIYFVMIRIRRNFDAYWNDNLSGVIIDECE